MNHIKLTNPYSPQALKVGLIQHDNSYFMREKKHKSGHDEVLSCS